MREYKIIEPISIGDTIVEYISPDVRTFFLLKRDKITHEIKRISEVISLR